MIVLEKSDLELMAHLRIIHKFEHAMGNSLGNFSKCSDTVEKYMALLSIIIWDLED